MTFALIASLFLNVGLVYKTAYEDSVECNDCESLRRIF
jgi:hypothetical protein